MRTIFPSEEALAEMERVTPEYMRPNHQPWVVVLNGYLDKTQCQDIAKETWTLKSRDLGCGARTRECPLGMSSLSSLEDVVREVNKEYWGYILDATPPPAWVQTYGSGNHYGLHMDGAPSQSRKLTGIAMLTDPDTYTGGILSFFAMDKWFETDNSQGTVVVIPHWLLHQVSMVESGLRQTVNMGFYGPPFV